MFVWLDPSDTLFFRDARPFNQDDPGQAAASSVCPPHPTTVVGALRAAIARSRGIEGDWSGDQALRDLLGSGVDWQDDRTGPDATTLGRLSFHGPYVHRKGEVLLPAPLHLLGLPAGHGAAAPFQDLVALQPVASQDDDLVCDLGSGNVLPRSASGRAGLKSLAGFWMTLRGMQAVINGATPDPKELVAPGALWDREPRVGIARSPRSHAVEPSLLYAATHVRMDADHEVGLVMALDIEGNAEEEAVAALAGRPIQLGGEHRFVWPRVDGVEPTFPAPPESLVKDGAGDLLYTVILITPADLTGAWPLPNGPLADLPGILVSACTERPVMVGGWSSLGRAPGPLPSRPLVPAGSVFFLRAAPEEATAETILSRHRDAIGRATRWGFGRIMIARCERE